MNIAGEWRTRMDPAWTGEYGVEELHVVMFEPCEERGGARPTVMVQIPETRGDRIGDALRRADELRARLVFLCDTRVQAEGIAELAGARLLGHRRISYERAAAGCWGINQ